MRIAVLIIGLCLTMMVGLQSCVLTVGSGLAKDQAMSGASGSGLIVAFLFLLASALVLGFPRVSAGFFLLAAVIGIGVGFQSSFADLRIWASSPLRSRPCRISAAASYAVGRRRLRARQSSVASHLFEVDAERRGGSVGITLTTDLYSYMVGLAQAVSCQ